MTTSTLEIQAMLAERRKTLGPAHARAREVRDAYNGDIIVALPEMEKEHRVSIANQIQIGIDQMAKRTASTMPHLDCPPVRRDFKGSEDLARKRKWAISGWWEDNRMPIHLYQRARHLLGYTSSPVSIWPDLKNERPLWVPRDPLSTYPAPAIDPNDMTPPDTIVTYTRSLRWLRDRYPDDIKTLSLGAKPTPDTLFELVEYCDCDEMVLLVVGRPKYEDPYSNANPAGGGMGAVELQRYPNRAGMCLTVVPSRITLDRQMSAFEGLVPLMELESKLAALQYIAAQKGVFPREWFVNSNDGIEPRIIQNAIPEIGQAGIVVGGTHVEQALNPAYTSIQMVDRLENAIKQQGGIPSEFGGESGTNIRTGRRGDSVLSQTVDFTLQELQTLFGYSLQEENKRAIAVVKAYWGNTKKSFYFGQGEARVMGTYTPNVDFETDDNLVTYAYAGADTNSLTIEIGQNLGLGILSKKSAMRMHPMILDADNEHDRVIHDALEEAVLQSIQQGAATGAIPPTDVGEIMRLVDEDRMELTAAIASVQKKAQERQAQQVPPTAPEAQPGIAVPGAGAEATVAPPPEGSQNVASLLAGLRGPAQTLRGGPQKGA